MSHNVKLMTYVWLMLMQGTKEKRLTGENHMEVLECPMQQRSIAFQNASFNFRTHTLHLTTHVSQLTPHTQLWLTLTQGTKEKCLTG